VVVGWLYLTLYRLPSRRVRFVGLLWMTNQLTLSGARGENSLAAAMPVGTSSHVWEDT